MSTRATAAKSIDALRRRISATRQEANDFFGLLIDGGRHRHPLLNAVATAARVLIVSLRKFDRDDCFTKASALTYTLILSLVPALAVILTVASLIKGVGSQKDELFAQISQFMSDHSIKINVDPLFAAISSLVDNALKIGGVSAIAMIFSATAMLRSLEKSLNDIWGVRQGRPLHLKIIYYWAAITLGPALLVAGTTVAAQIATRFTSPPHHAVAIAPGGVAWIGGGTGTLAAARPGSLEFTPLSLEGSAIDYENQRVFRFDPTAREIVESDDPQLELTPSLLARITIIDIQFMGRNAWALGTSGVVLRSSDQGATWTPCRIDRVNGNSLRMLNEQHGFMAADDGLLLETTDGGESWRHREWRGFTSNLTAIAFQGDRGFITSSRGTILTTSDGGKTWDFRVIAAARRKGSPLDITAVTITRAGTVWLAGTDGMLLQSLDGGETWRRRFYNDTTYRALAFAREREGAAAGDDGSIIYTKNGGATWSRASAPSAVVHRLTDAGGHLWAVGDRGLVALSKDGGRSFHGIQGGQLMVRIMNFLAPFAIIWVLFLLVYLTVPNTTVPLRNAAIGAAITGTLWVLFILGFIVYVRAFASSTFAVYGALAAIPLSLLMVYASTLIILYGAEVSYTLMHPESYRRISRTHDGTGDLSVYRGMAVLLRIFADFEGGMKGAAEAALVRMAGGNAAALGRYLRLFSEAGFICRGERGRWMPAMAPQNVPAETVIALLEGVSYHMPAGQGSKALRVVMDRLARGAVRNRREAAGKITLRDLLHKG